MKEHRFYLIVETSGTRRSAELDVLAAFGKRNPDNCKFHLKDLKKADGTKETWLAGARAGFDTALELLTRSIGKMRSANNYKRIKP